MKVFLELLLIATAISFAAVYIPIGWRRLQRRQEARRARPALQVIPRVAAEAARAATSDERIREALEIRERIADYARRPEVGLDVIVVHEVDLLVASMVELARMRRELESHLGGISEAQLVRDAGLLEPATLHAQRAQIDGLRARARGLEAELARAVAGLRETWLGLLDALAQPGAGSLATTRTRDQVEALRIRIQAEKEARTEVEPA